MYLLFPRIYLSSMISCLSSNFSILKFVYTFLSRSMRTSLSTFFRSGFWPTGTKAPQPNYPAKRSQARATAQIHFAAPNPMVLLRESACERAAQIERERQRECGEAEQRERERESGRRKRHQLRKRHQ